MTHEIRAASRTQAKPLIGLYSESGGGKTYSALLVARGFVGPQGRICMIETESGRGEAYADQSEYPEIGGYDVLPLRDDFSPKNYGAAIKKVEESGYDALIIDSGSHEWEGAGGVLDMASKNESAGKKGMIVWQQPKIDHQKHFMLKFMQTPLPLVILCMRAKYPMLMKGSTPTRSTELEPKQSDDILFEMSVHGWLEKDNHHFHPNKRMPRSLQEVFVDGRPLGLETGRKLAEWAKGSAKASTNTTPPPQTEQKEKPAYVITAEKIIAKIKTFDDAALLQSYMADDAADDMEIIKLASEKTYEHVKTAYNLMLKTLEVPE